MRPTTDLPEDRRIVLRIGINLGDVMVEGSDLYGDGVNIAARLEALAEPGSVFISQTVFSHVKGKTNLDFEDLGERSLKNMAEPVRVYRLSGPATLTTGTATSQGRSAVEALHRGPALHQHERRSGAGVLQRRHHRGHHHRPVAGVRALRGRHGIPPSPSRAKPLKSLRLLER